MGSLSAGCSDSRKRSLAVGFAVSTLLSLTLTSCNRNKESHENDDVMKMVTFTFDLPIATTVTIDDGKSLSTPVPAQRVRAGSHRVTIATACHRVTLELELSNGGTAVIQTDDIPGFKRGTIAVSTLGLDGQPMDHSIYLGGLQLTAGAPKSNIVVPICKYRLRVTSQGVGGFMEDIDMEQESTVRRNLVLAPGAEMVRIHGGPFTLGSPESNLKEYRRWDTPRKKVVIETFDIDKTEVTAAQFHECRRSGRCSWNWSRDASLSFEKWPLDPQESEHRYCTSAVDLDARKAKKGYQNRPMNCVSHYEAAMYCDAVGKRLPTATEWEFAARSRNPDYYCPWPPPANLAEKVPTCDQARSVEFEVHDVCSKNDDVTEQGLCDMALNVAEFVTDEFLERRRKEKVHTRGTWNSAPGLVMFEAQFPFHTRYRYEPEKRDQDIRIGFRCARSAILNGKDI